jgi:hypothetical protein
LLALFKTLAGRTFCGAVDDVDCVELVFSDEEEREGNLVSIFTDGRHAGRIAHGFVMEPEEYARASREVA